MFNFFSNDYFLRNALPSPPGEGLGVRRSGHFNIIITPFYTIIFFIFSIIHVSAQKPIHVFTNPIIHADYSDPDAIRVGDDYYMTASSFNQVPGLPILHSKDLVHWELIGHALKRLVPEEHFRKVQHGGGVWAPAIRYHNNEFYIYYPDPDFGIYLVKAKNITGPWSEPQMVEAGKGLIDPCPFWDDNGKAYLAHAYAGSRAGIKSIIVIKEMNKEGTKIISDAVMVYDGHDKDPTIEGPKLYKRNGYYYIFAPAGGVSTGWQTILRSKNIYGPYERKVALEQGRTKINGPHQGAWVTTQKGAHWFLHFQDKEAYGRIVHLQPMQWKNDWPVIGYDKDGDGTGEPVTTYLMPDVGKGPHFIRIPDSDEFNEPKLGLQWQWPANPMEGWAYPTPNGTLRMFSVFTGDTATNLWTLPNILAQKLPAESFTATVKCTFNPRHKGEKFGLVMLGSSYAYISIVKNLSGYAIQFGKNTAAEKQDLENEKMTIPVTGNSFQLRIEVNDAGVCSFKYAGEDGKIITPGLTLQITPGRWIGAKMGLFFTRENKTNDAGYVDVDWFRVE